MPTATPANATPANEMPQEADDYVEYKIYPAESLVQAYGIEGVRTRILEHVAQLSQHWIWHQDGLALKAVSSADTIPFLEGRTTFGEAAEDEWFVVWILYQLSKDWDVVISTSDSDGDFLLIEAAEYLPKWMSPQTAQNRVWIYNGQLHIVPLPTSPSQFTILPPGNLSLSQALGVVRSAEVETKASHIIQECINHCIQQFPNQETHTATLIVPSELALLIDKKPEWISKAARAFYFRDPISMRYIHAQKHFPQSSSIPASASSTPYKYGGVLKQVKFTRTSYAMLRKQPFYPPKKWMMPPESDPLYLKALTGLKLSAGMEIFIGEALEDRSQRDSWEKELKRLSSSGYFQGNIKGSQKFKELEEKAKSEWMQRVQSEESQLKSDIMKVLEEIKTTKYKPTKLDQMPESDSEEWLDVSPEELERMVLKRRVQAAPVENEDEEEDMFDDEEEIKALRQVIRGFNQFMSGQSGFEGVELEDWEEDERATTDEDEDDDCYDDEDNLFMQTLEKIMGGKHTTTSNGMGYDSSQEEEVDSEMEEMKAYMAALDAELSQTKIGQDFERTPLTSKPSRSEQPVNLDINLVKNMLESLQEQEGMVGGPAGNILASLGVSTAGLGLSGGADDSSKVDPNANTNRRK